MAKMYKEYKTNKEQTDNSLLELSNEHESQVPEPDTV